MQTTQPFSRSVSSKAFHFGPVVIRVLQLIIRCRESMPQLANVAFMPSCFIRRAGLMSIRVSIRHRHPLGIYARFSSSSAIWALGKQAKPCCRWSSRKDGERRLGRLLTSCYAYIMFIAKVITQTAEGLDEVTRRRRNAHRETNSPHHCGFCLVERISDALDSMR